MLGWTIRPGTIQRPVCKGRIKGPVSALPGFQVPNPLRQPPPQTVTSRHPPHFKHHLDLVGMLSSPLQWVKYSNYGCRTDLQNAWQHYLFDHLYRQAETPHAPLRRVVRLLRLRRVLLVRRHVSTYHDNDRTNTTGGEHISAKA